MKTKTFVIILSRTFPKGHPKAGAPTFFKEQIQNALLNNAGLSACDCCEYKTRNCDSCGHKASDFRQKIHTIRGNYELWAKRIKAVQDGKAILSIRQWSDKPYRSKQEVICNLSAKDEIGIQALAFNLPFDLRTKTNNVVCPNSTELSINDGLDLKDFEEYLNINISSGINTIIHFTGFRY